MESTFPVGFRGNHEFATGSPDDWIAYLQLEQIPTETEFTFTMLGESGATDHSSNHSTAAGAGADAVPLHLEVNAVEPESGGGGGTAVRGSCKRKKLAQGSSSQRSTPPEFSLVESDSESEAGLVESSDPSSSDDTKPPAGSTGLEILTFLERRSCEVLDGQEVNRSVAEQDQTAPVAARSYTTTVAMTSDQKTPRGYWKERQVKTVLVSELFEVSGLKRTFQFHRYDGTKTNWFMHEYISWKNWGLDLYMEDVRFREVYQAAEAEDPGEPTSPEVKIKSKTAAAKKHRMRGPENLVIKGESPAWQHFIKIYDRHPELEGSKVVYAVCFHCQGVLKAGTDNGTKSLLSHCNRTCPTKNKNQTCSQAR